MSKSTIENIKVSIVVAIYKVAPYLNQLIQSVIDQTHRNIEIILVDDGSPDECGAICDKYAKIDSRIIVIHKPNGGGCDARNKGMEKITGEYFTIMDGDDWLEPNFVEYLLSIAVSMDAEMAITDSVFTSSDTMQNEVDNIEQWTGEKAATEIIALHFPMGCWNKLYKTEMIKRHNLTFSVPWHGEGMYFCTMASQYANYVAKGHRRIYHYRTDNLSSSSKMYNVQNGINGLWNIENIYNVSIIRTPAFLHTVEWHIYLNHNFLIRQIVGTNTFGKYWREYVKSHIMLILMLPKIIKHGCYTNKQKFSLLKRALFPMHYQRKMVELRQN